MSEQKYFLFIPNNVRATVFFLNFFSKTESLIRKQQTAGNNVYDPNPVNLEVDVDAGV